MKILHTADWHLGKKLDNFSRFDEQREVLEEICQIADNEQVSAIIVAGDLFDNFNPSAEASELLYSTLHRLSANGSRLVLAIAGNHDSPERIEVPDALARACGIIFVGYPNTEIKAFKTQNGIEITKTDKGFIEVILPYIPFPLRIIHTPYANELRLKKELNQHESEAALREHLTEYWQNISSQHLDNQGFNILATHLFVMKKGGEIEPEPDDEKPILHIGGASAIYSENFPKEVHYVALGHLHRYQIIDKNPCPIVYSSSPLAYSFAEANQTKNVVIIEAEKGNLKEFRAIELQKGKKLLAKKFDNIDEAVLWLHQNPTSLVQLTIKSNSFLEASDKKRLLEAHDGIIQIIPEIKNMNLSDEAATNLDLTLSVEELFKEFFISKKGQAPNSEILDLFKEVLSIENGE